MLMIERGYSVRVMIHERERESRVQPSQGVSEEFIGKRIVHKEATSSHRGPLGREVCVELRTLMTGGRISGVLDTAAS